jgi:phosphoheptose isomerase
MRTWMLRSRPRSGGKLLAAGNGGSAAEAQHLTGELLGRLSAERERPALPAIALHGDSSTVTAVANDYGYRQVFARQVDALGCADDVLIVFSTSGSSENLVAAADGAAVRAMVTVGVLGSGLRALHEGCTHVLAMDAPTQQSVQECHLLLVHVLVEQVEGLLRDLDSPPQSTTTSSGAVARSGLGSRRPGCAVVGGAVSPPARCRRVRSGCRRLPDSCRALRGAALPIARSRMVEA